MDQQLTAGITHEIQNPLNFTNNFSEVSAELVAELRQRRSGTPGDLAKEKDRSTGSAPAGRDQFNIELKTDFDTTLAPVEVVPQELVKSSI